MRRRKVLAATVVVAAGALALTLAVTSGPSPDPATSASHREAPLISEDPSVDATDVYAFVSPDKPDTVTLMADWNPFEEPSAGPNWYGFSTTARYDLNVDNTGDGKPDITYRFQFKNTANSSSNALPLGCIASPCQTYTVTKITGNQKQVVGSNLPVAPNNIGPRTFPNNSYPGIWNSTIRNLSGGGQVFAGPADDPFFGDIGAAFDLIGFRFDLGAKGGGKDAFAGFNVHVTAIQVPISQVKGAGDIIGVWADSERPAVQVRGRKATTVWKQVARLGNPLVNELLITTNVKDQWNQNVPAGDAQYDNFLLQPKLAPVINSLYNLQIPTDGRTDLKAIFHQGLPDLNQFGSVSADMLRLNLAIPPATNPNRLTVAATPADPAGWPNGRRLLDDVIDLAENGLEGAFFTPQYWPVVLGDGVNNNDVPYQNTFPYVAQPAQGFADSHGVVTNPPQP
jgi:Domain of unknown function (DUF4331)